MIKLGDNDIKICLGDNEVSKIYLGDTLVYSSSPVPPTPYKDMYLTFNIISGGTISWRATSASFTKEIFYSINDGEWTSIVSTTAGTPINLSTGDVIKFKGDGAISTGQTETNRFRDSTIVFEVYGNVMSLIDSTGFTTATTAPDHSFRQLFSNQTGLTSAENLVLPATTIGTNVYKEMFRSCTSLTKGPELPATTMQQSCYMGMFYNCTSLTTAPELPATTLAQECYRQMFYGCNSLTTAPELPATTLAEYCYYQMFYWCSLLIYVKCLAMDISATNCTTNWLNVSSTGTFVKNPSMNDWPRDISGIPINWTVIDA